MPDTGLKIATLYAWIATDKSGNEGICVMSQENGGDIPLVSEERGDAMRLREFADDLRRETGFTVKLKMFAAGVIIETLP